MSGCAHYVLCECCGQRLYLRPHAIMTRRQWRDERIADLEDALRNALIQPDNYELHCLLAERTREAAL